MRKKTLMITGASGFIGSNFTNKYRNKYHIVSIDLLTHNIEDISFQGIDCILHLAALVHQSKKISAEKYFEINTKLTEKIAIKAKENGVGQFVFYSTVAVYGTHGDIENELILNKNSTVNPITDYAKSKWEAEKILQKLEDKEFKVSILRPPMVYGEGCPGNMKKLEKLVNFFPILPFNYNKNKRTLVHIDRLIERTSEIIDKEITNIIIPKDEKNLSILEIVKQLELKNKKKRILIKFPNFLFQILVKLKPDVMKSLYGSLCFE